jgi:hypothetical protein
LQLAALLAIANTFAGPHGATSGGGVYLEPWQVINLVGAPLLALLFLRPVVDDLKAWISSIRE